MGTIRTRFDIKVTKEGASFTEKFELDKTVKSILGILITSDREDFLFYRGSQKIEINGTEYFPEGYESKLLMVSLNIAPNNRYYNMNNAEPGNGIITFTYTDNLYRQADFMEYRVSLYVECEV